MTADINKMYKRVMVNEADRYFKLIVWKKNPSDSLRSLTLDTVTYGTAPVPILAIRCLTKLSELGESSRC